MTASENIKIKLANNISFKLGVIFVLIILIQIPLSYVRALINEREQMQQTAQNQISKRWGGRQYIGSPILKLYSQDTNILNTNSNDTNTNKKRVHFTQAKTLATDIQLDAQIRYLGIFEAAVFIADIKMSGLIENKDKRNEGEVSKLFIPIKNIKRLKAFTQISINNQTIEFLPQPASFNQMNGIEIDISKVAASKELKYDIEFQLAGSEQFDILPLAKNTHVEISSNWPSPSFVGNYVPENRTINDDGFNASWEVNKFVISHNNEPESLINTGVNQLNASSLGVNVLIPANIYQVNERTVKYSFLIVLLTFAGFFLAELFFKLRLHPFQYLLIGVSLSVFYLLLLSISEYLMFNWAFLISASSIVLLIGSYCTVVLQQRKRGVYTSLLFILLYGFIFILVKAEEASLLMGSIGIWLILAFIMYITRTINWFSINETDDQTKP